MSATASDIAAGTRAAKIVRDEAAGVKAAFPNARDQLAEPSEGFFDAEADAAACLAQRRALIGDDRRRRFTVTVDDLLWPDPETALPSYRLIDAEHGVDATMLGSRIEIDLEIGQTTLELFG